MFFMFADMTQNRWTILEPEEVFVRSSVCLGVCGCFFIFCKCLAGREPEHPYGRSVRGCICVCVSILL